MDSIEFARRWVHNDAEDCLEDVYALGLEEAAALNEELILDLGISPGDELSTALVLALEELAEIRRESLTRPVAFTMV